MAGFRGVQPSRETLEQIVANIAAQRAQIVAKVVNGADPHQVTNGRSNLGTQFQLNGMMAEIFGPMLDEVTAA